jgi:hypothetical protein
VDTRVDGQEGAHGISDAHQRPRRGGEVEVEIPTVGAVEAFGGDLVTDEAGG